MFWMAISLNLVKSRMVYTVAQLVQYNMCASRSTHARAHARAHARTHAHTHTHTYTHICRSFYNVIHRGKHSVTDIDECVDAKCDVNAVCVNTAPGYACSCKPGFEGNGHYCQGTLSCVKVFRHHSRLAAVDISQ